jgi:hypothetical protein
MRLFSYPRLIGVYPMSTADSELNAAFAKNDWLESIHQRLNQFAVCPE